MAKSTLRVIAGELALAMAPLVRATATPADFRAFLLRLGWVAGSLPPSYQALGAKVGAAIAAASALGDDPDIATVGAAMEGLRDLVTAIRGLSEAPAGVDASSFLAEIADALLELLLCDYLAVRAPTLHRLLVATGVIKDEVHEAAGSRPTYVVSRFHWDEIPHILGEPSLIPQRVYGWGTPDFNVVAALDDLMELAATLGIGSRLMTVDRARTDGYQPNPADVTHAMDVMVAMPFFDVIAGGQGYDVGIQLLEFPAETGKLPGLVIEPLVPSQVGSSFAVTDELTLSLRAGSDIGATFGIIVRPGDLSVRYPFEPGKPLPSAGFGMTLAWAPPSPSMLLGRPAATRLQIAGTELGLRVDIPDGSPELVASLVTKNLALVLGSEDRDGFLSKLLGGGEVPIAIPLGISWSSRTGLGFAGGNGLSVSLAPHLTLGPVRVQTLTLALTGDQPAGQPARAKLDIGAGLDVHLGPVDVVVSGLGLSMAIAFADGNLGPVDLSIGLRPPDGAGISVDAGFVKGGGFLRFDQALGQYSGAVALDAIDVAIQAYGVIETKLPGGAAGYSFIVLVSTEFTPGVALPFGFTLDGVGGLLGVNRSIAVNAVQTALWAHHLDGLLFPANPVATAPTLIAALDSYFPATEGRYLVGPMAKIGWGSVVEAVIGVFLELPAPLKLFLLGEISVAVPRIAPQLELHIDFDGGIDFGQKLAFFDASLHDSRVERYPITGDLAFRYAWGSDPSFALAIGGFNPHFQPPAGFPSLKRVSITIGQSGAQLLAQAYFALTSNTLQFGASIEITAGAGGFDVHGWLGFDALCEWSPFSFEFDLSAGVDLRHGSTVLASVHLDGQVTGPSPWHVSGDASLSLFFFDVSVHFDKSWGDSAPVVPPVDPLPPLRAALAEPSSYASVLPPYASAVVTPAAAPTDAGGAVLLDPAGGLRIAQRVVPLGQPITRYGGTALGKSVVLSLDGLALAGRAFPAAPPTLEEFAPAQFQDLDDATKLSLPSFESLPGGALVGADAIDLGASARPRADVTPFSYDTTIVDTGVPRRDGPAYVASLALQLAMNGRAAAASARRVGLARYAPAAGAAPRVTLAPERYVIAGVADAAARADLATDGTKRGALAALAGHVAGHPEETSSLQVLLASQAQEAA